MKQEKDWGGERLRRSSKVSKERREEKRRKKRRKEEKKEGKNCHGGELVKARS